ncbi:hypothetical protein N7523_010861 [Penicillium sp. IBT 18751x]|nr:hypothetical protein N7523_010861 [Penicillium sp. IBT 18751x]
MDLSRHIQDLADELLSEILSFVLEPSSSTRNCHSYGNGHGQDSIDNHSHQRGEASDLDRWRLVCKRFMRIGTPRKFSRFVIRFSLDGFRRLEELLKMQLACYVRTVTYLVRPFYTGSGWTPVLQTLHTSNTTLAEIHSRRLHEQTNLIETDHDLIQLSRAIAAFPALQEIKLLRLQDSADEQMIDFLHTSNTTTRAPHFNWELACSRAVANLGIALLDSQCTAIRFIGPQISPEATLKLLNAPSTTLAAMGSRLTSLDITFHSSTDISSTMADLSDVFGRFFAEAKNLVSIHIGFPPKSPLDLDLEAIFHETRWKTLRTLSLQGWILADHEIISLARRHRRMLREIRLGAIYLRRGGRWRNVLAVLRGELERLERVELREIDYEENFDLLASGSGVEVFDVPLGAQPDTLLSSSVSVATGAPLPVVRNGLGAEPAGVARGRLSAPWRSEDLEKLLTLTIHDMDDDGARVQREQVGLWEAWVQSGLSGVSKGQSHLHLREF